LIADPASFYRRPAFLTIMHFLFRTADFTPFGIQNCNINTISFLNYVIDKMKKQLSIPIVILTCSFMLPLQLFGGEKATTPVPSNPFQALPANASLVQQIEAISLKFDEAFNKHDGAAVMAFFTTNATQVSPVGTFNGGL
jgi:hypothetical protein